MVDPKNIAISFSLALTSVQTPLIHVIKNFLDSYVIEDVNLKASPQYLEIISQRTSIYIKEVDKNAINGKPVIVILINPISFIVGIFIPLLSDLKFVTKKYKDFLDWAFIASLIYKGKHLTEIGKEFILKISKRMNKYRLSTFIDLDS